MHHPVRRPLRHVARLSALALLAALLFALPKGYSEPRNGWRLEARVPATTLGLVTLEDVGGMSARMQNTALGGLFQEPEMKAFMAPIEAAGQDMLDAGEEGPFGEAGPMLVRVLKQLEGLRGQIAVAVVDMDMESEKPRLVASLDFGPHIKDFVTFVQTLRAELDPEGENIQEFERDGRLYWSVDEGMPVIATTADTAFVLATDEGLLASVLAGTVEKPLSTSDGFRAVRTKSGGEDLAFFAFANMPAIAARLVEVMDDEGMRMARHLGLDTIHGIGYGMAFVGDGFMDSFVVHAPGAEHGLVPLVSMPAFKSQALKFVPEKAFYYEEGSADLTALLPRMRTLIEGIEPGMSEQLDEGLAHVNEAIGVDLEKEILAGLAGPSAWYMTMPESGGLYPELALFLKAKDPAAYERVLERAMAGLAGMLTEEGEVIASTRVLEYRGQRLHLLDLQAAQGDDVIPFTPTWTLLDGWWVITLVPHAMKEVVLRHGSQTGGGLAAQEDFQALMRVMPETAGAMSYLDL
ncbi:MAG: hypothetical protein O2894_00605 [Planctomycetota bacterium]|nr:hypothetical protein [Planctomycetota bacterium]